MSQDQIAKRPLNFGEKTSFMLGLLSFKLRVLAKQVSQGFMYSFLVLITLGNCPFLPRAVPPSSIVSGLNWAGELR